MQFDFGRNWADYSRHALTRERVAQARTHFAALFQGVELSGRSFLDIGFGQGLSLLSAATLGARVVGCEINPRCVDVLHRTADMFPQVSVHDIPLVIGSILDAETEADICSHASGGFDIVHSWGVLCCTGEMQRAIQVAAGLVASRGHLVIAVYNQHWSSPAWLRIKRLYGSLPGPGRRLMVAGFLPVIWAAKLAVTRQNPLRKQRGMSFYYDVVDWVGGYPYEYATEGEIRQQADELGFDCLRVEPPQAPTGCNEFVLRKRGS